MVASIVGVAREQDAGPVYTVARVQEVAADGIPPTSHAVPLVNVFREDTVVPCLDAETVLSQAPAVEQQRFRVPRILAED